MTAGVSIEPATLHVDGLVPGGTAARTVTVRNDSGVPVVVTPRQQDEGLLLTGPTPVAVTYGWGAAPGPATATRSSAQASTSPSRWWRRCPRTPATSTRARPARRR
jgi:hypothetical protein